MKIRTGFVSNSSSSNFIIDGSYKTVFDLAKAMINIRDEDYDGDPKYRSEITDINKAIREGKDPNSSIFFMTCNYDTYIRRIFDLYIVTSCNNHSFIHDLEGIIHCPTKITEWLKENNYFTDYDGPLPFTEEIDTWKFQCEETFWSPKYDLELSRHDYMEARRAGNKDAKGFCSDGDHFCDMMVLASNGKIICPACYKRKIDDEEPGIDNRFDILDL
jgi:hypothetical protein